ncbi:MAG: flagellar basal-body rod protein FlgB [Zetaproteobacteria bacterium CG2_30_46_52]|nr:MAG: flagellar basal-body rod protein FlgB [Zetaproteobacteria bacterium CG2_30_46_52]
MADIFSDHFLRLGAAAAAREQTQTVISSNIANADTPHYQADKRGFSDFYKEKLAAAESAAVARTHPNHISGPTSESLSMSVFQRSTDEQRMDGNTVDVEQQMSTLAENQLMFELNMKILQGRLDGIGNVIKEAGR